MFGCVRCIPGFLAIPRLFILLTLGLGSCATTHLDKSLPLQETAPFSETGEEPIPDRWWMAFDDPNLNSQIEQALGGNFSLDAAWARVMAARALTWRESSDLFPDLDGVIDAGGSFRPGPNPSEFALGLEASYEPDLWGRIRSSVEAERLRTAASQADYETTSLFLSADIAATWFALVEAHAQYELAAEQIETNRKGLTLLETRFAGGEPNSSADVLRQRQLVESTQEQAVLVQLRIEQLEHQLAILQGRPPQAMSYDVGTVLPTLPPMPATGLPSDLLWRRPDVRREFLALLAADRDVATAVSDQYPRINLAASITTAAESPENLLRDWIASLSGQLVAPLLDAGERRAEIRRTESVVRQRVAEYGETVLFAFREVEDALAAEKYALERIALIESQIELAEKSSILLDEQYITGVSDYLSVLTTIREQQRLQRALLSTKLDLVLARIELYRALSGDIQQRPPAPDMPSPIPPSEE